MGALTPVADALQRFAQVVWVYVGLTPNRANCAGTGKTFAEVAENSVDLLNQDYDLVVLLGDRYETLAAASIAHLLRIPIAHLSGGDVTEGSLDDSMRHAITKLAHLHFTTHDEASHRILQMGEEPWRVYTVGCPSVDNLVGMVLYSYEETARKLGVAHPYYLVSYQPATLDSNPGAEADRLLAALERLVLPCVFTTLNADAWGAEIQAKFDRFCVAGRGVIGNMDNLLYASAMKHCQVMIGNSSSGFYEAPTLKTPFVNIGNRQKGRIHAYSVLSCPANVEDIIAAVHSAKSLDCSKSVNPYGDGQAAKRIASYIETTPVKGLALFRKRQGSINWHRTQSGNNYTASVTGGATLPLNSFGGPNALTYHRRH